VLLKKSILFNCENATDENSNAGIIKVAIRLVNDLSITALFNYFFELKTNIGKIEKLTSSDNKSFPILITRSGVQRLHYAEKNNIFYFFGFF
jgi:hypothetical protein